MKRNSYIERLNRQLESIGRYDLKPDWDAENARGREKVRRGPSEWNTIEPSDFGPEHDYTVKKLDEDRWVIYCVSKAALHWCYDKLPEDCPRWCDKGFIIEDRYLDFIEERMQLAGLMSLDEFNDSMEELNSKMREWE